MTSIDKFLRALTGALVSGASSPSKVLFVVDHPDFSVPNKYSTGSLTAALSAAGFSVETLQFGGGPAGRPDLASALADVHEAWFFLKETDPGIGLRTPETEALRRWMDSGGGVMLTGDHAERKDELLRGLGAPIGARIPRARHLRVWDDGPGIEPPDLVHNSTSNGDEKDRVPQRLVVPRPRHEIFGADFDLLPDHRHEGKVLADPAVVAGGGGAYQREWARLDGPEGAVAPPDPRIIARGVDWQRGALFDLMVAWDGDVIGAGRILADASWHHYVDYNLGKIKGDEEAWKKIQGLYKNMAAWLLPERERLRILAESFIKVLQDPIVIDYEHFDAAQIGARGLAVLERGLPDVLHHELRALLRAPAGSEAEAAGFEPHLLGAQLRGLRRALDSGQALTAAAIAERSVLQEAVTSYKDVLTDKSTWLDSMVAKLDGGES